jgi:hypothetical protein
LSGRIGWSLGGVITWIWSGGDRRGLSGIIGWRRMGRLCGDARWFIAYSSQKVIVKNHTGLEREIGRRLATTTVAKSITAAECTSMVLSTPIIFRDRIPDTMSRRNM